MPKENRPALRRFSILVGVLAILIPTTVACDSVDRSLQLIDSAVASIDAAPGNWESAGKDLIDKLGNEGQAVLDRVEVLVNDMIGQAGNLTFCVSDYFGIRLSEGLKYLGHELDPKRPAPVLLPVVCNINPATHVEKADQLVTLFGYNFAIYNTQHSFKARIEYGDANIFDDDVGAFSVTSNYQLSLALQDVNFGNLEARRNPKIVITWNQAAVSWPSGLQAEIPIQLPIPPQIEYSTFDFRVEEHANSGYVWGDCTDLSYTQNVNATGKVIDTAKGDPQHPGISQLSIGDNRQSVKTLRGYNYQLTSPTTVKISGEVCGAGGDGPGAIFSRAYRIYLRSA